MRPPRPGAPGRVRAVPAALVSTALLGVNGLAYVFTVLAARALLPQSYGELAALLGVLLVGAVPTIGMQTTAALVLAGRAGDPRTAARLHATAAVAAVGVCLLGVLAVAPLRALLHLTDPTAAWWLALLLVPHTLVGAYDGILQGSGRYGRLAVVTAVFGLAKFGGATAGLLAVRTPTGALGGMAAGCAAGALFSWVVCGRPGLARDIGGSARSLLRACRALLGLVLLVNLDLLLARHHLPARLAGEYAVAAVFAKVAFWLPQGVGVVLLPQLADPAARRRLLPSAVALVAAIGAVLTLATAALGPSALRLVGGAAYGATLGGWTWVFTVLGTAFSIAQLLLYSGIAAADRVATAAVWGAAALEVVVVQVLAASGALGVLTIAGVAVGAGAVLVGAGLLRPRRSPSDPGEGRSSPGIPLDAAPPRPA